jgi:hypothetical protein
MCDQGPRPPGTQVYTATLTTSATGVVVWALDKYVFGGYLPPDVYAFTNVAVPTLLGRLGAQWAYRRARSRHECADTTNPPEEAPPGGSSAV